MAKASKTLIIILSETRAWDLSFASFKKNLLESENADLALCVAANHLEETSNPFYQHARYVWTYPEPDDWSTALDYAQATEGIEGQDWRQLFAIEGNFIGGLHSSTGRMPGSGGISMFFRWYLKRCLINEPGLLASYDRFILTRSDYIYLVPHYPVSSLEEGKIWIPLGEDYHGYTDRHLIADRELFLQAISLLDPIIYEPSKLLEELKDQQPYLSFEGYIKYAFARAGLNAYLRRFPYTMFTVRHQDGRTSWSKGSFNQKLGYCIKYKPEYILSLIPTAMVKRASDWTPSSTTAFFMISNWIDSIDWFARFRIRAIRQPYLRTQLINLVYGTFLSDRFYEKFYPQLAGLLRLVLSCLPVRVLQRKLNQSGYSH